MFGLTEGGRLAVAAVLFAASGFLAVRACQAQAGDVKIEATNGSVQKISNAVITAGSDDVIFSTDVDNTVKQLVPTSINFQFVDGKDQFAYIEINLQTGAVTHQGKLPDAARDFWWAVANNFAGAKEAICQTKK